MEFRWIAVIALWTLIAGPIFQASNDNSRAHRSPAHAAAVKTTVQP